MDRRSIAFLLLGTFYCSFGYPLNETSVPLGKSLQLLADKCGDTFLSTQILNKVNACNISLSAENEITEQKLECLIFYDINNQLCTALGGSKQNLSKSYDSSMNQTQRVDVTCEAASKNWKFSHLPQHPKYYNASEKIFKTTVTCLKACGVKELFSEDTNFFCKYYHWGSELLPVTEITQTGNVVSGEGGVGIISGGNASTSSPTLLKLNDNSKDSQPQVESPSLPFKDDVENTENVPPTNRTHIDVHNVNIGESGVQKKKDSTTKSIEINKGVNANELPIQNNSRKNQIHTNELPAQSNSDKTQIDADENQQSDNFNDDVGDDGNEFDSPDDALPHDPNDEPNDDPGLDLERTEKQKNGGAILSSSNGGMPQKEMYSNTITNQFVEEDDHFFSFFLTAIILVIFLYILYHNKSKFRKVFLGLLVEGRQPGRRRNSRGHEYRRLDTLEQAMSTNSTAPPSKIIY